MFDEAMAACRRAIQLDPNDPSAYCNLATGWRKLVDMMSHR